LPEIWAGQKGLNPADAAATLHPVQQAWIDEQVPQCGYCQSGMMIVAVELLAKNPNPTVAQIKDAFTHKPTVAALMPVRHLRRHYRCRTARGQDHEGLKGEPVRVRENRYAHRSCGSQRFPNPNNAHAARLRPGGRRAFCVAGIASSVLRLY